MVVSPSLPLSSFFVREKNLNKLICAAHIGKKSDCVSSAFCFVSYFLYAFFPSFEFVFNIILYIIPKSNTDEENAPLLLLLLLSTLLACMKSESLWGWVFIHVSGRETGWGKKSELGLLSETLWSVPVFFKLCMMTCTEQCHCYIRYGQGNAHNSLCFFICIQSEQKKLKSGHTFFLSLK